MSTMQDIKTLKENSPQDYQALKDLVAEVRAKGPEFAKVNVKQMYDATTPGETTPAILANC